MQPTPAVPAFVASCAPDRRRSRLRTGLRFFGALVAGAIVFGVMQGSHPVFHMDKKYEAPSIGMPPAVYLANRRAQEQLDRRHAMLYVGLLGGLVAAVLLITSGTYSASPIRQLAAIPLGVLLGTLGGMMGAQLGSRVHEHTIEHIGQPDLLHTVLAQVAVLLPLGLGVGLGAALSASGASAKVKTAVTGLLGGLAAALAYPVAVSLLLPTASTDLLLPIEPASRLLWFLLAAGSLGVIVPLSGRPCQAAPGQASESAPT